MSYRHQHIKTQGGFTLVEVMLVIVLMAIMASLVAFNVQGISHRKVFQARELLLLDLRKIRMESVDQGRILGLTFLPETDVAPPAYQVVEYVVQPVKTPVSANMPIPPSQYKWQVAEDFKTKTLPEQTILQIQSLERNLDLTALQQDETQEMPKLIWLGNGEVLPASLQLYSQQQPVGDPIVLNYLGLPVTEGEP